jgi:hypothetical protein
LIARAAVVVDDLDVVPVRVEHERAVVARVVHHSLARRAVVLVARRERGGVERAHSGVLARGERKVDVLRERPLVSDERETVFRAGQLHAAGLVVRQTEPGVRGDRRVLKATLVLALVLLAAYVVAVWAMAGKPS